MIRHSVLFIVVAVAGLFAYSALGSAAKTASASARSTMPVAETMLGQADVKQIYLDKCSVCHGEDGAAKTAKGKKLKMKDIRSADVQKISQADWVTTVQKGKGDDMDAFEKDLGADTCKKLADYMRELSKK